MCVYLIEKLDSLIKDYWATEDIGIDAMMEMERLDLGVYIVRHDPPEDVGVIIEGCTVLRDLRKAANGCAVLFGLIYCLNLSYPKELRYTFEFLQKVFMELDGNKLSTKVQGPQKQTA